jgi:hypothetical protein
MTIQVPGDADGGAIVPGHRDKYALVERERRFLLAAPPSGSAGPTSGRSATAT